MESANEKSSSKKYVRSPENASNMTDDEIAEWSKHAWAAIMKALGFPDESIDEGEREPGNETD